MMPMGISSLNRKGKSFSHFMDNLIPGAPTMRQCIQGLCTSDRCRNTLKATHTGHAGLSQLVAALEGKTLTAPAGCDT